LFSPHLLGPLGTIKKIADGSVKGEYPVVSTIENEAVLDIIHEACEKLPARE
jgi:hypothetical protein